MHCHANPPPKFSDDKFVTTVKLGPRGQIVIPKEARELFGIRPGDNLLLLADQGRGIVLLPQEEYRKMFRFFEQAFPPEEPS